MIIVFIAESPQTGQSIVMHNSISSRMTRKPDDNTTVHIPAYLVEGVSSTVFIELDGTHGSFINKASRKDYFIASGAIKFTIDGKEFNTVPGDIISVPVNLKHAMEGKGCFFVIATPPYNPETEDHIL